MIALDWPAGASADTSFVHGSGAVKIPPVVGTPVPVLIDDPVDPELIDAPVDGDPLLIDDPVDCEPVDCEPVDCDPVLIVAPVDWDPVDAPPAPVVVLPSSHAIAPTTSTDNNPPETPTSTLRMRRG